MNHIDTQIQSDFTTLLSQGHVVNVHIQGDHPDCNLPEYLHIPLMALSVEDFALTGNFPGCSLEILPAGFKAVLGFQGQPREVFVPWCAIYAINLNGDPGRTYRHPRLVVEPQPEAAPAKLTIKPPSRKKAGVLSVLKGCKSSTGRRIDRESELKCCVALRTISDALTSESWGTPMSAKFIQEMKMLNSLVASSLRGNQTKGKPA